MPAGAWYSHCARKLNANRRHDGLATLERWETRRHDDHKKHERERGKLVDLQMSFFLFRIPLPRLVILSVQRVQKTYDGISILMSRCQKNCRSQRERDHCGKKRKRTKE